MREEEDIRFRLSGFGFHASPVPHDPRHLVAARDECGILGLLVRCARIHLEERIRAIAADDLWLSPCYQQPCVTIHFTWKQDWPAVRKLMPIIEKELAPFNARPHWGKLFTTSPRQLRSIYKKLPEFIQLAKQYDPQGKFRNEFLNLNIFSG